MKHSRIIVFVIALQFFVAGCSSSSAAEGKWLDYGDGIINLNLVASINLYGSQIKFDSFTLSLANGDASKAAMETIKGFLRDKESYLVLPKGGAP